MLFLTTNRIGAFDDAFISRVHIQLYYPEFTDKEREMVWKTFTDKLKRERGNYIRLDIDAREYISGAEMRAVEWNGREIRNGEYLPIITAIFLRSLAFYASLLYRSLTSQQYSLLLTDKTALQTAVALAEYDAQKDEEGRIIVTDTHLKAVVELSADFKKYLNELHSGNESKRAERKYERLDDYEKAQA